MSSYVTPAGSSTCTNPRVRACARLQAVHAGTGTRMHAHTHARTRWASNPSTAGSRWGSRGSERPQLSPDNGAVIPGQLRQTHHLSFQSPTSRADLVQALGSAPSHPIQDPACTPVGLSPTTSSQCLLQPPTSSALPAKAQLQGFHEEAHSATASSAPKGGQAPPWVGTRGCCPRATWGPPMRLHRRISHPRAGREITSRLLSQS